TGALPQPRVGVAKNGSNRHSQFITPAIGRGNGPRVGGVQTPLPAKPERGAKGPDTRLKTRPRSGVMSTAVHSIGATILGQSLAPLVATFFFGYTSGP